MNKTIGFCGKCVLLLLYVVIVFYAVFAIAHLQVLENFPAALVFQILGCILLGILLFWNHLKFAFRVGLIATAVVYQILLLVWNFSLIWFCSRNQFLLAHLILLFLYLLISLPLLSAGSKSENKMEEREP